MGNLLRPEVGAMVLLQDMICLNMKTWLMEGNLNVFGLSILFLLIVLSGCASPEEGTTVDSQQVEAQTNEFSSRLEIAAEKAKFNCRNKQTCDKAFRLAWYFVKENSDTTIQYSDDTIVNAFNPTTWGKMGLTVTKTFEKGDLTSIKLSASCKGINRDFKDPIYLKCVKKIEDAYLKFGPYIESRLQ
jgi:uncharacterized protein YcfL